MEKLSAYILTKNSEVFLPQILDYLSSVADEIIVVDSGSTDKTESITGNFDKARFIFRQFTNFREQRIMAAENCKHDMILFLDDDEIPDDAFLNSVMEFKHTDFHYDAYKVSRKWNVLGKDVHCMFPVSSPDHPVRLFRKSRVTFSESTIVHETPGGFSSSGKIEGVINHITMNTREEMRAKLEMYTDLAAQDLIHNRKKVNGLKLVFSPWAAFLKWYFIKGGYKDGYVGLLLGNYAYQYTFKKYLKAGKSLKMKQN